MAIIENAEIQAGKFITETPASGILFALMPDASVFTVMSYDPATGYASILAPLNVSIVNAVDDIYTTKMFRSGSYATFGQSQRASGYFALAGYNLSGVQGASTYQVLQTNTIGYSGVEAGSSGPALGGYVRIMAQAGSTVSGTIITPYQVAFFDQRGAFITGLLSTSGAIQINNISRLTDSGSGYTQVRGADGRVAIALGTTALNYQGYHSNYHAFTNIDASGVAVVIDDYALLGASPNNTTSLVATIKGIGARRIEVGAAGSGGAGKRLLVVAD